MGPGGVASSLLGIGIIRRKVHLVYFCDSTARDQLFGEKGR
ncbi:hypothetical protein SAMN05443144_1356 [Fodinibius roseus]|uniref:Uncharacterized protein n=1 Tax=Fodinibius roseus TaxID=1194090 RepID=A0A1M5KW12_9BACT|nr:hypothetical protein SAMN05443144_1356 [Fodinibius roseus]